MLTTARHLIARSRRRGCSVCGRPTRDTTTVTCERCGIEMHDPCFSKHVVTPAELSAAREDRDFVILCRGCRS